MSHRTQITLTDAQYARLLEESERTGLGLAELTRRALDRAYPSPVERMSLELILDRAAGLWADRDDLPDTRGQGAAARLADVGLA
ncbi:MAG: CopG family transcriptional regulator [Actinomycetota bacterium]